MSTCVDSTVCLRPQQRSLLGLVFCNTSFVSVRLLCRCPKTTSRPYDKDFQIPTAKYMNEYIDISVSVCIYMYTYICVYIYIERERESEGQRIVTDSYCSGSHKVPVVYHLGIAAFRDVRNVNSVC